MLCLILISLLFSACGGIDQVEDLNPEPTATPTAVSTPVVKITPNFTPSPTPTAAPTTTPVPTVTYTPRPTPVPTASPKPQQQIKFVYKSGSKGLYITKTMTVDVTDEQLEIEKEILTCDLRTISATLTRCDYTQSDNPPNKAKCLGYGSDYYTDFGGLLDFNYIQIRTDSIYHVNSLHVSLYPRDANGCRFEWDWELVPLR